MKKVWLFFLGFALCASASGAQESSFSETLDVRISNLEVVVEDGAGRSVRGLKVTDFELFEDGQKVDLSNFSAIEDGQAIEERPHVPGEPAMTAAPALAKVEPLRMVVYLDDAHLSAGNRKKALFRLSRLFETQLKPGDQVQIARFGRQVEVLQPLTDDLASLKGALERYADSASTSQMAHTEFRRLLREMDDTELYFDRDAATEHQAMKVNFVEATARSQVQQISAIAEQRYQTAKAAIAGLESFVESLAGISGRKALLMVSDGIPVRAAEGLIEAWLSHYEAWANDNNRRDLLRDIRSLGSSSYDTHREFEQMARRAASRQVIFYPFSTESSLTAVVAARGVESSGAGVDSVVSGNFSTANPYLDRDESLRQVAAATGGVALLNSINLDKLFDRLRHDFTTFYSLGYRSKSENPTEQRKVVVKVKNKDWKVRHAAFAVDRDPLQVLQDAVLSALQHGVVSNPLEMKVELAKQSPGEAINVKVELLVKIPFAKLLLLPQGEVHQGRVTLFVVVSDAAGGISPFQRIELPLKIPSAKLEEVLTKTATYPLVLQMAPGRMRIVVGARDVLAQIDATTGIEIEVFMPEAIP